MACTLAHGALRTKAMLQAGSARRVYEAERGVLGLTLTARARGLELTPTAVNETLAHLR